jgi:hypothetical protein
VAWYAAANAPDGIPYSVDAAAEEGSHPSAGMDHWACYTNDGNRALLRDLLASDVMTGAQFNWVRISSQFLLPGALLLAGLSVWWRRR